MTAPAEPRVPEPRAAVIEGSLREVTLADVLQLLDMGRKTGVLRVTDALGTRSARVTLFNGRIHDAAIDGSARPAASGLSARDVVIELLDWSAGRFAVEPIDAHAPKARGAGVGVDAVLMEAARRADEWARLADRIADARVVVRLVADSGAAPAPVALSPEEWELLAFADGAADLQVVAERSGRDVLAVARAAHRLVGEGLLEVAADPAVPQDTVRSSED